MRPQLLHRTILRNRIGAGISVLSAIVGLASHKESIMRIALIAAAGEGLQSMHRGCFLQRMAFAILEGLLAPVMSTLIGLPPDWYLGKVYKTCKGIAARARRWGVLWRGTSLGSENRKTGGQDDEQ